MLRSEMTALLDLHSAVETLGALAVFTLEERLDVGRVHVAKVEAESSGARGGNLNAVVQGARGGGGEVFQRTHGDVRGEDEHQK